MEKKLILLSHICIIEYVGLVLWLRLWSLESNDNAANTNSTKNHPFCVFSYYCEKDNLT